MKLRTAIVSLTGLMMSIAAIAGEQHRRVEIVIDVDEGEPIAFDSEAAGFDPLELQLGESRSVIDADGNTVFIVRTEEGFEIETNGQRVAVPDPASLVAAHIDAHIGVSDGDTEGMRRVIVERVHAGEEEEHEVHVLHEADTDQDVEVEHEIRIVRGVVNDTN